MRINVSSWPTCSWGKRPWKQQSRAGTREDRTLSEIEVCIPPLISDKTMDLSQHSLKQLEEATREVISLEASSGKELQALGALLLRTESVASSKIEQVEASIDDYARAFYGSKHNESAMAMVAGTRGFEKFMKEVDASGSISNELLANVQKQVVSTDPQEDKSAGQFRKVQNWIEGSDFSPRGAIFIPPPPEMVERLMDDLVEFSNRSDLNVLFQASVSHAQFETIHPFTDGNGRVGRALINGIYRRRELTKNIVIPLASSIVAHRERYFAELNEYRQGNPLPLTEEFARGTMIAAQESKITSTRLAEIPEIWRSSLSRLRTGGATEVLLNALLHNPVVTAEEFIQSSGFAVNSVYSAIDRLLEAGVLRALTNRKRNQVWGASAVLDELEDLSLRIRSRAR